MKAKKIRTEFDHFYLGEPVIIRAACYDVFMDEATDLMFTFFDKEGNQIKIEYDEDELEEVESMCIEKLGEAKDEMVYDDLEDYGYLL